MGKQRENILFPPFFLFPSPPSLSFAPLSSKERLEVMNKEIFTKKQAQFVKDKLGFAYKWSGRSNDRRRPPRGTQSHNPVTTNQNLIHHFLLLFLIQWVLAPRPTQQVNQPNSKGKKTSSKHQSAHTPADPSPEANWATGGTVPPTLHHLIPKVLGSALVNPRNSLLDIDFFRSDFTRYQETTNKDINICSQTSPHASTQHFPDTFQLNIINLFVSCEKNYQSHINSYIT